MVGSLQPLGCQLAMIQTRTQHQKSIEDLLHYLAQKELEGTLKPGTTAWARGLLQQHAVQKGDSAAVMAVLNLLTKAALEWWFHR